MLHIQDVLAGKGDGDGHLLGLSRRFLITIFNTKKIILEI